MIGLSALFFTTASVLAPLPHIPNTEWKLTTDSLTPPVAGAPVFHPFGVPNESQTSVTFATLPWPWGCIAFQESTDSTTAVNPLSGDQGAFQFSLATWDEFAPAGYPTEPIEATLGEQYDVALLLWQARGFEPWVTASECGA